MASSTARPEWGLGTLKALAVVAIVFFSLVLLSACRGAKVEDVLSSPIAVATPTPLPAPTPSPTPTPTPAPTPIPIPLQPMIELEPSVVSQGRVALVRVRERPGLAVSGSWEGGALVFAEDVAGYWAVLGVGAGSTPGPRTVTVMVAGPGSSSARVSVTFRVGTAEYPVERVQLGPEQASLLDPALVQAERDLLMRATAARTPRPLWRGLFSLPTSGPMSSPFGLRRAYNDGPPGEHHGGLDIAAEAGAPVVAPNAGRVVLAQSLKVRGNAVVLDHGLGLYSGYFHLAEIAVQEGQAVAQGELLGLVGETGLATGPHLHWEVLVGGVNVDPAEWLQRAVP